MSDNRYLTLIESAKEYNKKQHDRWDDAIKLYKGECTQFRQKALKKWQHLIEVNFTRPTVDTMLPSIIFKTPKVFVRPSTEMSAPEAANQALMIENKLNAILNELQLDRESKRAVKDALLLGVGYIKLGLTTDADYDVDKHPFSAPFAKRVSPWEVLVDPACRTMTLEDAEYIVFENTVPLQAAKNSKTLDRPQRLEATGVLDCLPQHIREDRNAKGLQAYEFTTLYELWHRGERKLLTLDKNGKIYNKVAWPYDIGADYPLVTFSFNHVPEEFYCPGEPDFLYSLQLEASEKRTQQLNHTRRFNRKYQMHPDTKKDDRDALQNGDDGTIVISANPVNVISDAPLQADINTEYNMILAEVKEVSGIYAYQRGGSESGVYSATAAKIIDSNASIRTDERRQEVAASISRLSRILYNILREDEKWPVMDFNFNVDVASMQKPDDEGRRQQLMSLGQVMAQSPKFKQDAWIQDISIAFHKPPEHYLYSDQEMQQMQANQPPDPEQQKLQMEQQRMQAEMQMEQQKMQLQMQADQQKQQMEMQKMQAEQQMMQLEVEMKRQEFELEKEKAALEMQIERERLLIEREKLGMEKEKALISRRVAENDMIMKGKEHDANISLQMQKMQQGGGSDSPRKAKK